MDKITTTQEIWDNLYKEGKNVLSFPNENLVRYIYHLFKGKDISSYKLLDFGFGSGSNFKFMVDFGFDVYGYEVSEHAKQITLGKLPKGYFPDKLRIKTGETELPFDKSYFDCVVAWQVLNYNTYDTLQDTLQKLKDVLKDGGQFICTMTHPHDVTNERSKPVQGFERIITTETTQENATTLIIPDETNLKKAFHLFKNISIGYFECKFNDLVTAHWMIYGEK